MERLVEQMKILIIILGAIFPFFSIFGKGLVNDKAVMKSIYGPVKIKMPKRIFSPEIKKLLKAGKLKNAKRFFSYGNPENGKKWLTVPDSQWEKIISPIAPVTARYSKGKCPFCGKAFGGVATDILNNPFQGKSRCCGNTVYAREKDMPANYPAKPNYTLKVPHLNEKTINYRFYVPKGSKKNKKNWFTGTGETAWSNLVTVIYSVLPDLEARVLFLDDKKAAHKLAVIFKRLVEVYPGWPYYNPRKAVGIATCADLMPGSGVEDYLLPEVWESILKKREKKFDILAEWNSKGFSKLPYAWGYGTDGNLKPGGSLAEVWDLISRITEVQNYSKNKYGSNDKLDSLVRNKIFKEESLFFSTKKPTLINMMEPYINNALKISIVAYDKNFFKKIYRIYDGFIYNHHFEDGLSTEGSFNYSAMMGYYTGSPWIYKYFFGVDFRDKYPLAKRIHSLGDFPVKTLYNVESIHGDEHAAFFASRHLAPPQKIDYSKHEKSMIFPFYGLACLRSGNPGSRLEAIVDYQNQLMHAQGGRLNLQLFYEGINLLPDVGYCKGDANIKQTPWKNMKTALQTVAKPRKLAQSLEGHCTGAIDGSQWDKWTFLTRAYSGNPDSFVQYIDIDGKYTYSKHPYKVSAWRRKLITVTFSDGRSCLVDIFKMTGGKRHDMYWHVPGKKVKAATGKKVSGAGNVYDWYNKNTDPKPAWRRNNEYLYKRYYNWKNPTYREETKHLKNPVVTKPEDGFWTAEWNIDPNDYMPEKLGHSFYAPWKKLLHPVRLKIWGSASGDQVRDRLINARGEWASNIMQNKSRGSLISFKDGFDYMFFNRQAKQAGLNSTFVHILEPFNPEQKSTLKNVKIVKSDSTGILLQLETNSGETVHIGTIFKKHVFNTAKISFNAQLAAWSDKGNITLYGGNSLKTKNISLKTKASWKARLQNVVGDITGKPQESALIIKSSKPLPLGKILNGMPVFVKHKTSAAHVSVYEIDKISAAGKNLYRIDLKNKPPFIQNKFYVSQYNKRNPEKIKVNMRLFAGVERPHGLNRRIRFPKSGFETSVAHHNVEGYAGWWTRTIMLKNKVPAGKIKNGDPVIIYSVAKGDRVLIPSLFCKKGETVFSSGKALLKRDNKDLIYSAGKN